MDSNLSLTGRRWTLRRSDIVGTPDTLIQMLAQERGLSDVSGSAQPKLSDPYLFPEMGMAAERIRQAITNAETVAIFGDYDADGITGTAQLIRYFRRQGLEPIAYLPHRMKEGYGMKKTSVDALHQKGAALIITVDTGIASGAEIEHAKTLGIDTIVTDHHHPPAGRPPAYAVIHPHVPADFPNAHLSGSGVAFMLVRALEKEKSWPGIQEDFVLASIGTIADMVPLIGENRTLVMHGLKYIRSLPPGPLRNFADAVRLKGADLTSTDIAFRLVPRINASGRMDDPAIALDALLQGGASLNRLHQLNTDRQSVTRTLYEQAHQMVDSHQPFLCVQSPSFTAGLVGLIAGKLTEKYGRPSLVAAVNGEISTASLRSIPQVDIMRILSHPSVQPFLITFGGHTQAAGCTFKSADFDALRDAMNLAMIDLGIVETDLVPTMFVDAEVAQDTLSPAFVDAIRTLEPFGRANEEPRFLLRNQKVSALRTVGADGKHLQARIGSKKAVGFNLGHFQSALNETDMFDVVCRFGLDTWNGAYDIQVMIEDVRKATH